VRLHAVYRDRVLLERGGTLESLTLPRQSLVSAPPPKATAPTPGQRLQALTQTSGALLGGLIRVQAVLQQGALQGYRIFPGVRSDPAGFAQLGLRAGDLITAVNGTPLDDPNRSLDILQTLSAASSAEVTIVRQGVQQDISLNLAAVASHAERAASAEESAPVPSEGAAVGNRPQVER
jgi:general secretion pathway protein C